jgi:hypothetical protein
MVYFGRILHQQGREIMQAIDIRANSAGMAVASAYAVGALFDTLIEISRIGGDWVSIGLVINLAVSLRRSDERRLAQASDYKRELFGSISLLSNSAAERVIVTIRVLPSNAMNK